MQKNTMNDPAPKGGVLNPLVGINYHYLDKCIEDINSTLTVEKSHPLVGSSQLLGLNYPKEIIFGNDSFLELARFIPQKSKVLLVTGKSTISSGIADKAKEILINNSCSVIDATGMTLPEPPLDNIDKIVAISRENSATAVLAIGGGSTIDVAKVVAAITPLSGKAIDYFNGSKNIDKKGLFFIALPTTAGTGAEITKNSVITDPVNRVKKSIRSPFMIADVAIIDPKLTLSMPKKITATSGLDALTQAIESFTSSSATIVTKSLAKPAVKKLYNFLLLAYKDGDNIEYRKEVAEGSLLSAMAFSQSGLGAVHGLAHPIGSLLKIPHGLICSILLPTIMKFNAITSEKEYSELAIECGLKNGDEFIEAICELSKNLNIPSNLNDANIYESHFAFILENCRSNSMKCNPRYMSDDDIIELLNSFIN